MIIKKPRLHTESAGSAAAEADTEQASTHMQTLTHTHICIWVVDYACVSESRRKGEQRMAEQSEEREAEPRVDADVDVAGGAEAA